MDTKHDRKMEHEMQLNEQLNEQSIADISIHLNLITKKRTESDCVKLMVEEHIAREILNHNTIPAT